MTTANTETIIPTDPDSLHEFDTALRDLAHAAHVATEYRGSDGTMVTVSTRALAHTLHALGLTFSNTPASVQACLTTFVAQEAIRFLPRCVVSTVDGGHVSVRVIDGEAVRLWISPENPVSSDDVIIGQLQQLEDFTPPVAVDGTTYGQASFQIPPLGPGYYTLWAQSPGRGTVSAPLIVRPTQIDATGDFLSRPGSGLMAQLYSVRDRGAWGMGDAKTLETLAKTAAPLPYDFILTNPLHAAEPVPPVEDSPYLPTTRLFTNPIYIRPDEIEEVSGLAPAARQRLVNALALFAPLNESSEFIERNPIFERKLLSLWDIFNVPRSPQRQAAFQAFKSDQGASLEAFAQWCAQRAADWFQKETEGLEEATPVTTESLSEFYGWLQWVVEEQFAKAQEVMTSSGCRIGLMTDLAVGVHPGGFDAQHWEQYLAPAASVGAPPDGYNQMGQDWSQPPWHPWKLAEAGYTPWRALIRAALRNAGGVRIDHVLGLFRLWWIHREEPGIPSDPREGTYVYYDADAMLGVLAIEANRAHAVIVGEDLGTFDPETQTQLQNQGILGTSILWFEGEDGRPKPAEHYRSLCLASVGTHDLPPTAGYLAGEHIALRERLGVLKTDPAVEYRNDLGWQNQVLEMVRQAGFFNGSEADVVYADRPRNERPSSIEIVKGLYAFLAHSPAALTCTCLVDVTGDLRAQNQPGTTQDLYRNWCIPLCDSEGRPVLIEDLPKLDAWASEAFSSRP